MSAEHIRAQVNRIVGSQAFQASPKLQEMLSYIAARTLAGEAAQLKEYAIAVDAFGRGADFDPRGNNIVRRQADRLREKLEAYFADEGAHDAIRVDVPKGHYVLKADIRSAAGPVIAPAPAPAAHNLPAAIGALIGREDDLNALSELLAAHRLVTICGAGGLGKSRLALATGSRVLGQFPDGVWFVALDRLSDPTLVTEAVLTTLGLPVEGNRPPIETIVSHLAGRRVLVILDSAEHVLGAVGYLVLTLLGRAPGASVLLTTREALGLADEQVYRTPPLALPPEGSTTSAMIAPHAAVDLFVHRGRAALGRFDLADADAAAVAGICRKLDGIPLAIELAAARLSLLTPRQLDAALADRLSVLSRGPASAPARQRTLQATLDWSYALLSEDERRLLQRLSVFVGNCSLEAVLAVAEGFGDDDDLLNMLSSLVDKSLVAVDRDGGRGRYRLLETTRSYAAEKRHAAGDREAEPRLAAYVAAALERARVEIEVTKHEEFIARYGGEIDNIRTALAWAFGPDGDIALALRIAALSTQLMVELSLFNEARRWLERAERHIDETTPPLVAGHILMALAFRYSTGINETLQLCERACAQTAKAGDSALHARALLTMVQPLRFHDAARVDAVIAEAIALTDAIGPTKARSLALGARAFSASLRSSFDEADRDFAAALQIIQRFDYRFAATWVGILNVEHALLAGRFATAERLAEAAWLAAERNRTQAFVVGVANLRAACALLAGRGAAALYWLRTGLSGAQELGDNLLLVAALENLALAIIEDHPEHARKLVDYCVAQRARLTSRRRPSEAMIFARIGIVVELGTASEADGISKTDIDFVIQAVLGNEDDC